LEAISCQNGNIIVPLTTAMFSVYLAPGNRLARFTPRTGTCDFDPNSSSNPVFLRK
jgi:hypothetical protein